MEKTKLQEKIKLEIENLTIEPPQKEGDFWMIYNNKIGGVCAVGDSFENTLRHFVRGLASQIGFHCQN